MSDGLLSAITIVLLLSLLGLWRESPRRQTSGSIDGPDLSYIRLNEET